MDTFSHEDCSLENDPSPHRKPVEVAYDNEVMWSRRRAPDTRRAAVMQYSVLITAILFEYQLFVLAEHCSSPTDNTDDLKASFLRI